MCLLAGSFLSTMISSYRDFLRVAFVAASPWSGGGNVFSSLSTIFYAPAFYAPRYYALCSSNSPATIYVMIMAFSSREE